MHQHPVLAAGPHAQQLLQAVAHGLGTGGSATGSNAEPGVRGAPLPEAIGSRDHQQHPVHALHRQHGGQRVHDHGLARNALVLLGQLGGRGICGNGAQADARAGNQPQHRGADAGDDDAAAFALSSVMDSGEKNRSVMHSILKSPFRPKA
jgi:hypothetical protein